MNTSGVLLLAIIIPRVDTVPPPLTKVDNNKQESIFIISICFVPTIATSKTHGFNIDTVEARRSEGIFLLLCHLDKAVIGASTTGPVRNIDSQQDLLHREFLSKLYLLVTIPMPTTNTHLTAIHNGLVKYYSPTIW